MGLVQDPNHLGVVILDKLIGDLKSKMPFLSKKKGKAADDDEFEDEDESTSTETEFSSDEDVETNVSRDLQSELEEDEEEEEVTQDDSFVGKIRSKLAGLTKKKSSSSVGEDTETTKAKRKPNIIVIAGAVALIAFIAISDFGDNESTPEVNPESMLKKRPRPKKPKPAEQKPAETAATATTTEPATTEPATTEPATTEPTTTEPATTEPATTEPAITEPTTTEPVVTEPTTTEEPVLAEPSTTEPVLTEPTTETPVTPESTESTPVETSPMGSDNTMVDSVTGDDAPVTEDNLTDQILKDLEGQAAATKKEEKTVTEYVAPPNYENVGRGLVYNCAGKHWACVDGPSYKTCEQNSSSTKYLKRGLECYPFNVYQTQSGCEKMQNRMVSSSAKTGFCTE